MPEALSRALYLVNWRATKLLLTVYRREAARYEFSRLFSLLSAQRLGAQRPLLHPDINGSGRA